MTVVLLRTKRARVRTSELAERFRARGLKPTPQRVAIYRALEGTVSHPSAEWLFKKVRPAMPSVSLGTVYKTLDALESAGLVRRLAGVGEAVRYDAKVDEHHHLICTRCEDITDIELHDLPKPPDLGGFEITGIHVQVLGVCRACKSE